MLKKRLLSRPSKGMKVERKTKKTGKEVYVAALFVASIGLAIVSNVFYHIFQKWTPANANPYLTLTVTYLTAAGICITLLVLTGPGRPLGGAIRQLNWSSVGLGFSIVGLELGFLLAYRAGWEISLAQLVANSMVGLLLIPVGFLVFRERLAPLNLAGIVVCLIGLVMINLR